MYVCNVVCILSGRHVCLLWLWLYMFHYQHLKLSSLRGKYNIQQYSFRRDKGACGGELACSTCHLVFDQEVYDTLPPKSDEEEDMLDLAFELTET